MSITTLKSKTKQKIVRINIDSNLDYYLAQIKSKYPLLTDSEALKLIISSGLKIEFPDKFKNLKAIISSRNQSNQTISNNSLEQEFLSQKI